MYGIVLTIVVLSLCYLFSKWSKILNTFPEPPNKFLLGHGLQIRTTTNTLRVFSNYMSKYGPTFRVRILWIVGLVTTDYTFIEFLLTSNHILRKSFNYLFLLEPWLGKGLLTGYGHKWKQHRKILTPAFHHEILKDFVTVFESVADVLAKKLDKFGDDPSLDLCPILSLCTLDAICETAMGTKINAQTGENVDYVQSVQEMCRITTDRSLNPLKVLPWIYKLSKDYQKENKALTVLHSFTSKVIAAKEKTLKNHEVTEINKKMALLDLMLKFSNGGQVLSNDDLRNQVDTFMFAGHDTTASGICFTLFCLANHPEIQEKVFREQTELFGNEKNPTITYRELQNMKYLDLVIKESLRLYPPVPVIGRQTEEDITFDCHVIPKGTNIGIFIYGVHRNPNYFPEPEKFNPERFADFESTPPFGYIPFSAGPRNCIGQKFALLEMKSIISKVVRNFELKPATPTHELILSAAIVLTSANGVKVGIKKRG